MGNKYVVDEDSLTSVADAIREKTGSTEELSFPSGFVSEIDGIMFDEINTYTVSESWENDTLGNPVNIYNTVLKDLITVDSNETQIYKLSFKNNNAKNYKADCIYYILFPNATTPDSCIAFRNNYTSCRNYGTSTSAWATEGAIIHIYKLKNWKY